VLCLQSVGNFAIKNLAPICIDPQPVEVQSAIGVAGAIAIGLPGPIQSPGLGSGSCVPKLLQSWGDLPSGLSRTVIAQACGQQWSPGIQKLAGWLKTPPHVSGGETCKQTKPGCSHEADLSAKLSFSGGWGGAEGKKRRKQKKNWLEHLRAKNATSAAPSTPALKNETAARGQIHR